MELKPTETVKIPWDLFADLVSYFLTDAEERDPQTEERITQAIRDKAQAIVKRQEYRENYKKPRG